MGKTPFQMVYKTKFVMLMEFLVPNLCIVLATQMTEFDAVEW